PLASPLSQLSSRPERSREPGPRGPGSPAGGRKRPDGPWSAAPAALGRDGSEGDCGRGGLAATAGEDAPRPRPDPRRPREVERESCIAELFPERRMRAPGAPLLSRNAKLLLGPLGLAVLVALVALAIANPTAKAGAPTRVFLLTLLNG